MKYRKIKCPVITNGITYTARNRTTGVTESQESADLASLFKVIADSFNTSPMNYWIITGNWIINRDTTS